MNQIVCRPQATYHKLPDGRYQIVIQGTLENAHPGETMKLIAKRVSPAANQTPDEETIQLVVPVMGGVQFSFVRQFAAEEDWEYFLVSPTNRFPMHVVRTKRKTAPSAEEIPEAAAGDFEMISDPVPLTSSILSARLPDLSNGLMLFVVMLRLKGAKQDETVAIETDSTNKATSFRLHESVKLKRLDAEGLRRFWILLVVKGFPVLISFSSPYRRFEPKAFSLGPLAASQLPVTAIESLNLTRNEADELQKFYQSGPEHPFDDVSTRHTDLSARLADEPEALPTGDFAVPLPGATGPIVLIDEVFTDKSAAHLHAAADQTNPTLVDESPVEADILAETEPSLTSLAETLPPPAAAATTARMEIVNNGTPVFERRAAPAVPPVTEEVMNNKILMVLTASIIVLIGMILGGGYVLKRSIDETQVRQAGIEASIAWGKKCLYADRQSGATSATEPLDSSYDASGEMFFVKCDDGVFYLIRPLKENKIPELGMPIEALFAYAPPATE